MTDKTAEQVTVVEQFALLVPFTELEQTLTALSRRVEKEAAAGLAIFRFYYDGHDREVSLLMTLAGGAALVAHRDLVTRWPEWRDFAQKVERAQTLILGNPGEELEAYLLEQKIDYDWGGQPVAGITR